MSEAHPAVEVVTYDGLPAASGGAHRLRTRNLRLAWEAVQSFLDAWVLPAGDPTVTLVVWKGGPPGPSGTPRASLVWDAQVRLLDPRTGEPHQDVSPETFARFPVDGYGRVLGASGVRASIGTTASSIALWLSLPADDRLAAAARHLQHHVPVRLSPKHWRRWRPTRDGSSYRSTKTPSPLTE
ncbi:hypothetical protein [Nocardia farcinica]|uniref:hypothetical protein n=1 Tax=Nocardia farcinica TaxID=37329 RepID=UPI0018955F4F|nr:hypothetical protein [Nocardia farcinica]MBF6520421.1 hypothetical protein [Nocardia farcinica]